MSSSSAPSRSRLCVEYTARTNMHSTQRRDRKGALPGSVASRGPDWDSTLEALPIRRTSEFHIHDACQTDLRLRWHLRLPIQIALLRALELQARRRALAINRRAQPREVLQEELAARRI